MPSLVHYLPIATSLIALPFGVAVGALLPGIGGSATRFGPPEVTSPS